jgi:hypothetical protein
MNEEIKQLITNTIKDLVSDFLYYDRKEDEDLGLDEIKYAFENKLITIDECVEIFKNDRLYCMFLQ